MFPSIRQLPDLVVTYSDLYKRAKMLEVTSEVLNRQLELVKTDEVKGTAGHSSLGRTRRSSF